MQVVFKNCTPFEKCSKEIDGTLVDEANFINITMLLYNLIEYSENYSDTSGSLWHFKRDEIERDISGNHISNSSSSFKYKSSLATNRNGVRIVLPLKYLSNFGSLLEMPLINCKVQLSLSWDPNCVLSYLVGTSTFTITDVNLYVPIVILSTEDKAKLSKLFSEGFKRPV